MPVNNPSSRAVPLVPKMKNFIHRFSKKSPHPLALNPKFLSAMAKCKVRTNNTTPVEIEAFHMFEALNISMYTEEFTLSAVKRLSKEETLWDPSCDRTLCNYLAAWWAEALELAESLPAYDGNPLHEIFEDRGNLLAILDANRRHVFHSLFRQNNFGIYKSLIIEDNETPIGIIPRLFANSNPPHVTELASVVNEISVKNGDPLSAGAEEVMDRALAPFRNILSYMGRH